MMENPPKLIRVFVTGTFVLLAIIALYILYYRSVHRPWTRDGQVLAEIIGVSSQVSGQVIKVAVKDNQKVKKGELLFQIDSEPFELDVRNAEVKLDQARQEVKSLEAQVKSAEAAVDQKKAQLKLAETEKGRILEALKTNAVSKELADKSVAAVDSARADLNAAIADYDQAKQNLGVPGEDNVKIREAKVNLGNAKLNLSWTSIYAPTDGHVTNLQLREGDYAVAGTALLALVDSDSFYVYGYFKETQIRHIRSGDRAVVTLMSHTDKPIDGVVSGIGRAISRSGTANVERIVPEISATFDWVRLAQRVPVRIELMKIPEGIDLIAGTTASVGIYPSDSER
jgi:multidrug resistance efflux pump